MRKAALFATALIAALGVPMLASAQNLTEQPLLPVAGGNEWTYVKLGTAELMKVTIDPVGAIYDPEAHRVHNYLFPLENTPMYMLNDACAKTYEVNTRIWWPGIWERTAPPQDLKGLWYYCDNDCFAGLDYSLPVYGQDCFNGAKAHVVDTGSPVTVPAGTFPRSVTIYYEAGPCPVDRLLQETLVPGIGLVRRVMAHLDSSGETYEVWELCSALVGSQFYGNDCGPTPKVAPVEQTTWGAIKNTYR
jgi:hypothetical protein